MDFYIKEKIITLDEETLPEKGLVGHNGEYVADFHFDSEWFGKVKTARFTRGKEYADVILINDSCVFPQNMTEGAVEVGVYAAGLKTTTAAVVSFLPSVLQKEGVPADPEPDVYNQLLERFDDLEAPSGEYNYNVTATYEDGEYSASRSSVSIFNAHIKGKRCVLSYDREVYPLVFADVDRAVFSRTYVSGGETIVDTFEINGAQAEFHTTKILPPSNVLVEDIKLLGLGDSICVGNGGKGFVGNLGLTYRNRGVSGALLSNGENLDSSGVQRTDIPQQLVNFCAENSGYYPDAIIADGGINDYMKHVPLGTMSAMPACTESQAAALDRSTVIGALEYLFYQMVKLYPKSQRYFLTIHKMYAYHKQFDRWYYFPVANNQASYTQNDLYEATVKCCELYNVKIIDLYKDGAINTRFAPYRSADNPYINPNDGLHLTAEGYDKMYKPNVKMALGYTLAQ